MNKKLLSLSRQVGERLLSQQWQLSCAESCTGGWLARAITDVAGSSAWFESGYVTYSNAAKQRMLGLSAHYFEGEGAPGAVSAATVLAMAEAALQHSGADFAVATSGIAGPGGGSADKPVGTVWIAWAWNTGGAGKTASLAQVQRFLGGREAVRKQSVEAALRGLLHLLEQQLKPQEGIL